MKAIPHGFDAEGFELAECGGCSIDVWAGGYCSRCGEYVPYAEEGR